jgi:hypothetical protein
MPRHLTANIPYVCEDCGAKGLAKQSHRTLCDDCREERNRARVNERNRRRARTRAASE